MSLKTSELNRLHRLKQKVRLLHLDIQFLKRCKKNKLFPKFIKINIPIKNKTTEKVLHNAKLNWLNLEIKSLYSKQANIELQALELHLKITKHLTTIDCSEFNYKYQKIIESIDFKFKHKENSLNKKFDNLLKDTQDENTNNNQTDIEHDIFPNQILIHNQSSETFSKDQFSLLENGLNFNFMDGNDITNLVIDIESNIQYLNNEQKYNIRSEMLPTIKTIKEQTLSMKNKNYNEILKQLKNKNVFYLKADKGNSIVILNKNDYYNRVEQMLKEGPYKICTKNPIKKYTNTTNLVLKKCKNLIKPEIIKHLILPNPILPRLYCLPKIHKIGNQMRPIVSSINSPTYLTSKFILQKLQNLPKYNSFSIKNRYEFIDIIKDIQLKDNEILVSFDVVALYPNVPIETTLLLMKEWLTSIKLNQEDINEYIMLINLCITQNIFQFNGQFYSQENGTAMGNPLSCFIADFFMSHFETQIKATFSYFPRIWIRYVDDIFAVFDKNENINIFLQSISSIYSTIKFTHEIENNSKLPFLDLLVIRKNNKIEFDIYRKPTHVDRYIINKSHHPPNQKRAVFHSLIFRLLNTPLTQDNYNKEVNYIYKVAAFNGYPKSLVTNMLNKAKKTYDKREKTKLIPIKKKEEEWISTTFTLASKQVQKSFKKHTNKNISFTTKNNIKKKLSGTKDRIEAEKKSGIYEIKCEDCNKKYIGQTKRNLQTRFKEHISHIKFNRPEKSAVADHFLETGHNICKPKLLKEVTKAKYLNAWETYFINSTSNNKLINHEEGPIQNSKLLNNLSNYIVY